MVEGRGRLSPALAAAGAGCPRRGQALAAAGQLALQLGEAADAQPLLLEALSLAQREQQSRTTVLALSHLGCR
jgi:hypothetical protein